MAFCPSGSWPAGLWYGRSLSLKVVVHHRSPQMFGDCFAIEVGDYSHCGFGAALSFRSFRFKCGFQCCISLGEYIYYFLVSLIFCLSSSFSVFSSLIVFLSSCSRALWPCFPGGLIWLSVDLYLAFFFRFPFLSRLLSFS